MPTARYYNHLRHRPELTSPEPRAVIDMPAEEEIEAFAEWTQEHPEAHAWFEENRAFVEWDRRSDELRSKAIPLGLDLLGGVDVTLTLDRDKMVRNHMLNIIEDLRTEFQNQKVAATVGEAEAGMAMAVRLANDADAQTVADTINNLYQGTLEQTVEPAALMGGERVVLTLNEQMLQSDLTGRIQGAKKAIGDRVDNLGVAQPRIAIVGGNRIRVQVPGYKDPVRLIDTVIQPADLQFHLVHQQNDTFKRDPNGNILPSETIPAGATVMPGKLTHTDSATQQLVTTDYEFVVLSRPWLTGEDLRSASVTWDQMYQPQVAVNFKPEGARKFAQLTEEYAGRTPPRLLAIVLDGVVRSAPRLNVPIRDGRCVVEGGFSQQEATELSQILKAGSIGVPLQIESKRTVGATLGADSIIKGVRALALGAVGIAVFMIFYYGMAGVISIIALILNVLIILAIMAMSRATLTLSGIGGILLTIGMAVDANVLIYERIREELDDGKTLRQSIGLGFNRAITVILDSNITTLMTALVLLQFTEGSVFGFALTMSFGLLANLFTGLTVTYTLCVLYFNWKQKLSLGKLRFFHHPTFDFIAMRKFSFPISAVCLITIPLLFVIFTGGLRYGVDFAGGASTEVQFHSGASPGIAEVRRVVSSHVPDARILEVTDVQDSFIIDSKLVASTDGASSGTVTSAEQATPASTEAALLAALDTEYAGQYDVVKTDSFGRETGSEFRSLAFVVVGLASFAILLYLWFRFELAFGVAAVIALVHDLLVTVLLATLLFDVQITLEVVAALMVLLGFSVNDTIVVFDRIRENTRQGAGRSFREICNLSMNQSLSRTIITSGTLFIVVLVLLMVGG